MMQPEEMLDAITDNAVTRDGGKFDFINFDACLMNCVEFNMILSDYTDYYIASPEVVPGFGQEYSGWLNLLGEDPDMDTYELGKKIVDDFIAFYDKEEGDGASMKGTLAVVNTKALMDAGFVDALTELNYELFREAVYESAIYDEFRSFDNSLNYGNTDYFDFGILASQLSYIFKEAKYEDLTEDGRIRDTSAYTPVKISTCGR